jgi:uncharacterized protein
MTRVQRVPSFFGLGCPQTSSSADDYHNTRRDMRTIVLLTISNIFMTLAWYGHLKYKDTPLWMAIMASWGIAFVEYCFQVPANRIGHYDFTAAELKTIQEVITLAVFCVFSVLYLREPLKWNYVLGFSMMAGAVFVIFKEW